MSKIKTKIVEHVTKFNTVRNEFEFPSELSVGLPTLVQNPPKANNFANPTVWPPGKPPGKLPGKPPGKPPGNPAGPLTVRKKRKKGKKGNSTPGDRTHRARICSFRHLSSALTIELRCLVDVEEF